MSDAVSADESRVDNGRVFTMRMVHVGRQLLRVGRTPGDGRKPPLLMFNGIGESASGLSGLLGARLRTHQQ